MFMYKTHLHCIVIKHIDGVMIRVLISYAVDQGRSPGWVKSVILHNFVDLVTFTHGHTISSHHKYM
jgi:hypothetical protein